jgi:transcriptional regulator with XRE-family HTH domain
MVEPLKDFIRRIRMQKRMSCKDIEKRSAQYGKRISGSYVNRIENHADLNPTADRLIALADGLGVPRQELLARAAGLVPPETTSDEFHFIMMFKNLSPERQSDVLHILDMWHSK